MGPFFYALKVAKVLRVSVEAELAGLDIAKHTQATGGASSSTAVAPMYGDKAEMPGYLKGGEHVEGDSLLLVLSNGDAFATRGPVD